MSRMPREYATSSFTPVRLLLIPRDLVYENNGRIMKCGHEVCAGEPGRWTFLPNLQYSFSVLQIAWKI